MRKGIRALTDIFLIVAVSAFLTGICISCDTSVNSSSTSSSGSGSGSGNGEGTGNGGQQQNVLSVSNVVFDSISRNLTANVKAADGVKVKLTCNSQTETAVVANEKIALSVVRPFIPDVKGGHSYEVEFSAEGYEPSKAQIPYWPKEVVSVSCDEVQNIFAGGARDFITPYFALKNYEESSVSTKMSFKIFKTEGYWETKTRTELKEPDTSNWKLSDMIAFLSNSDNAGKTIEVHYSATPKAPENAEDLATEGCIVLHCNKDVKVKSAHIITSFGRFEARLFAEDLFEITSETETAGGVVSYQWQISDDAETFTDIAGATEKTFLVTKDNVSSLLGKTLRVKLVQTIGGAAQNPVYSTTYPVFHSVKISELYYDGLLTKGETFDESKIRGTLYDELGNSYKAEDFVWQRINDLEELGLYTAKYSDNFRVVGAKSSFYDYGVEVFANVQSVLKDEDVPELSSETDTISSGCVDFTSINTNLELSKDGGASFFEIPEIEFKAKTGDVLLVREKVSGLPGETGYVRESAPVAITVLENNIGKVVGLSSLTGTDGVVSGGTLIDSIELPTLNLKKKTKANVITITPVFNYVIEGCNYEFTWLMDGANLLNSSGVISYANNSISINKDAFGKDSYQIFCMVRMYTVDSAGEETEIGTVSSQTSLTIN